MKVLVTGASGYIGAHVVKILLQNNIQVTAVSRSINNAKKADWFNHTQYLQCDIHSMPDLLKIQPAFNVDAVIHLAWPNLPNYSDNVHIVETLPNELQFLKFALDQGVQHLMVSGTCLEYGLQEGALSEIDGTFPTTPYGFAKDVLRKWLEFYCKDKGIVFQWMRLFYSYGEGQSEGSLLSQLDFAIKNQQPVFNMSHGDQLRDYLPVEEIAELFYECLKNSKINGVINCCSGNPITVSSLVENYCKRTGAVIELNKGFYKMPDYEPNNFWGIPGKIRLLDQLPSS